MTTHRSWLKALSKRERQVVRQWESHTCFEFMEPEAGEDFYRALQRNRNWLEDHTNDALRIGSDIHPKDLSR